MNRFSWNHVAVAAVAVTATFGLYSPVQGEVVVNLQPCIISVGELIPDVGNVSESYILSEWYKGFWSASQVSIINPTGALGLTNSDGSGMCDTIYVGVAPTADQKTELQDYSKNFRVRIVYFDNAEAANDAEVQGRLKISQYWSEPLYSETTPIPEGIRLTTAGEADSRVSPANMETNPQTLNIYTRPVIQWGTTFENGAATIMSSYVDSDGNLMEVTSGESTYPSAAAVEWIGTDGLEELYFFHTMAWFDMGSWAWANYVTDWATRGVFQGERRYYLGPVVDDLLLGTNVFEYNGDTNEGTEYRMSGTDMETFAAFQDSLNTQYGSDVFVDFAYNGNGILTKVNSPFTLTFDDADIALRAKGVKVDPPGIDNVHDSTWLTTGIPGMTEEYAAGSWVSDDLLASILTTDIKEKFHWQSHTMSHLARDALGLSDCTIEDKANIGIAQLLDFYYGNENFNWYSMTSPGITGLFNEYCLTSGANSLMTCYPGDNTYLPGITNVSLVADNRYHPLTTTVDTNGYDGATIVPRFATFVYYNCVTPECLINENEYIRRVVCGCDNLDPSNSDTGVCPACDGDIQSFGSLDDLIAWEQEATTRQILGGYRDKYMFHQVNLVPTTINGVTSSLLQYWMEEMMAKLTLFIKLPIKTLKFDHLCENFNWHEALDNAAPLLKATKDTTTGAVTSVQISSGSYGYIPLTIPDGMTVDISSFAGSEDVTYGTDRTYYLATDTSLMLTYKGEPEPPLPTPSPTPVPTSSIVMPTLTPSTVTKTEAPGAAPTLSPVDGDWDGGRDWGSKGGSKDKERNAGKKFWGSEVGNGRNQANGRGGGG